MIDQIRRSSRSVCMNLGESWRRRRYRKHFVSKLNDCETESEETRVSIEFALRCGYITVEQAQDLDERYDAIIGQLVRMITNSNPWLIK